MAGKFIVCIFVESGPYIVMNFFNVVCYISDTRFVLRIGWPLPLYPHFPLDVGLHCYPSSSKFIYIEY